MAKDNAITDSKQASGDSVDGGAVEVLDGGSHTMAVDHGLHRALKQRHLQMIALGGVVGYVFSDRECDHITRGYDRLTHYV